MAIDIKINDTGWGTIDPMSVSKSDYVIGPGRPITREKIEKIRESINQMGLRPKAVTGRFLPDGRIEIIEERALWMALDNWFGSGDPREYVGVVIAPEGTNVALTTVKLNRAQQQYPIVQVINRWANEGLTEYIQLRNLINQYPAVAPGRIALCICTRYNSVHAATLDIENGLFVANNMVRGELQCEFLNHLFSDLRDQNRYDSLRTDDFVVLGRDRWVPGTFLIDYTGAPGRTRHAPKAPNAALILPQPGAAQPRVTVRGFIRYTLIYEQVVQDDINFPPKPFRPGRGNRNAWYNTILDRMGIPRP